MEALSKDLWVFIETDEEGKARNVGLELLNPGRRLADAQGGALVAIPALHHRRLCRCYVCPGNKIRTNHHDDRCYQ